jgi:hypothetical protein
MHKVFQDPLKIRKQDLAVTISANKHKCFIGFGCTIALLNKLQNKRLDKASVLFLCKKKSG